MAESVDQNDLSMSSLICAYSICKGSTSHNRMPIFIFFKCGVK